MAEKRKPLGIFTRTEPAPEQVDQPAAPAPKTRRGRPRKRDYQPEEIDPVGIGLTHAEGERLKVIAAELGTNRHDLLLWLVRGFMRDWEAGKRPETEQKTITVLKR